MPRRDPSPYLKTTLRQINHQNMNFQDLPISQRCLPCAAPASYDAGQSGPPPISSILHLPLEQDIRCIGVEKKHLDEGKRFPPIST